MKKIIATFCVLLLGMAGIYADNISVEDVSILPGETKTVNISLTNTITDLVGFQMDLYLPEGISINKAGCSLSSRFGDPNQTLTIGKQRELGENVYRLTSTSLALTPISGTSGTIITLSLTAAKNFQGGTANLRNINFVHEVATILYIEETSFKINVKGEDISMGDVNGDGVVGAADVSAIINHILRRPNSAFIFSNADMNGDRTISAPDVSAIINIILKRN
jgi:hypothetical protein